MRRRPGHRDELVDRGRAGQPLRSEVLRPVPGGDGVGDVDQGLAFLADIQGVQDIEGRAGQVDDVDGVAVLVDEVEPRVVGAGPEAVRLDAGAADGRDEGGWLFGVWLVVDLRRVCGGDADEAVGCAVDDGEVGVVRLGAGGQDGDDFS